MDHPFVSHRDRLAAITRGLSVIDDVHTIAGANAADRVAIVARCEPDIVDEGVRDSVERHAFGLACLTRHAVAACVDAHVAIPEELDALHTGWSGVVTGTGAYLGASEVALLETLSARLEEVRVAEEMVEADLGSSTSEDYSDSRTESSDSGSEGEEEEESE